MKKNNIFLNYLEQNSGQPTDKRLRISEWKRSLSYQRQQFVMWVDADVTRDEKWTSSCSKQHVDLVPRVYLNSGHIKTRSLLVPIELFKDYIS